MKKINNGELLKPPVKDRGSSLTNTGEERDLQCPNGKKEEEGSYKTQKENHITRGEKAIKGHILREGKIGFLGRV